MSIKRDQSIWPDAEYMGQLIERLQGDDGERSAVNDALHWSEVAPGELVSALWKYAGQAATIGITGPPGVGKSTLVPNLVQRIREKSDTVAVLAVDPSSMRTGGSLLADRAQIGETARDHQYDIMLDEGVWIRSFSSGGHLGGISKAILPAILTFDVEGRDKIIIETVGVGQSELDISSLADTTIVVMQPGSGDSLQAIKCGIMEIPDILCINKKDMFSKEARWKLLDDLTMSARGTPIIETNAISGEGVDQLLDAIDNHREELGEEGLQKRRQRSLVAQLGQISVAFSTADIRIVLRSDEGKKLLEEVGNREKDPFQAAKELKYLIDS